MDVGETFKVTTSDQTAHNIHPNPNPMTGNIPWNQSQPPGAPPVEKSWKAPEMIEVKCNIHPWMKGWLRVFDTPYYAITDKDGNFEIKLAPAGKVQLVAWHEGAGWVGAGGKNGTAIDLKPGETHDVGTIKVKK